MGAVEGAQVAMAGDSVVEGGRAEEERVRAMRVAVAKAQAEEAKETEAVAQAADRQAEGE